MERPRLPIAIVMERRQATHPWDQARWHPLAALPWQEAGRMVHPVGTAQDRETCLMSGLCLELTPGEIDGYFENWVAPEPKVFVLWHEDAGKAAAVAATVSYAEGARMLDSGDAAGGLPMHGAIHHWLGRYLQDNYRPRGRRGREHG